MKRRHWQKVRDFVPFRSFLLKAFSKFRKFLENFGIFFYNFLIFTVDKFLANWKLIEIIYLKLKKCFHLDFFFNGKISNLILKSIHMSVLIFYTCKLQYRVFRLEFRVIFFHFESYRHTFGSTIVSTKSRNRLNGKF